MQRSLRWIRVLALLAIVFKPIYLDEEGSNMVWAFAMQAGNEAGNFRELLGFKLSLRDVAIRNDRKYRLICLDS